MSKFKVGDRVKVVDNGQRYAQYGEWVRRNAPDLLDVWKKGKYFGLRSVVANGTIGTVVEEGEYCAGSSEILCLVISESGGLFLIGEKGLASEGVEREFIVIRRDGSDVIATHKRGDKIVKTAKAQCAPSDEFSFRIGAKLAFDRLVGREEPKRESLADIFEQLTGRAAPVLRHAPEPPKFKVGDRVVHKDYGEGIVESIDSSRNTCIVVFDKIVHPAWCVSRELSPAPEPKYYTGKVFAEKSTDPLFESRDGKIFEFVDGECVNASFKDSMNGEIRSINHLREMKSCTTWHEVKSDV